MSDSLPTPSGQMLIYQAEDGRIKIEARLENETLWLTQQQMSELFQTSRTNVVEHIKNIYAEGELVEAATCREFRQVLIVTMLQRGNAAWDAPASRVDGESI